MFVESIIHIFTVLLIIYAIYWMLRGNYSFFQLIIRMMYFCLFLLIFGNFSKIAKNYIFQYECTGEVYIDNVHLKEKKACTKQIVKQLHIGKDVSFKVFKIIDYKINLSQEKISEKEI